MFGLFLIPFLCLVELAAVYFALKGKDEPLDLEDFHRFYHD